MLSVGLTGGIGCGKTVVTDEFARLGTPIIDTDLITRELTLPGTATLESITREFGESILDQDGNLNRRRLRECVFDDSAKRKRLEAILHPAVRLEVLSRIRALRALYCITVVPLMIESGMHEMFDRILVVDCDPQDQVSRVVQRDQCSKDEVHAIMRAQATREQRLAIATEVLCNDKDLQSLYSSIKLLHEKYLKLSGTS